MASNTYRLMKDNEFNDTEYSEPVNFGNSLPMYLPANNDYERLAPVFPFSGSKTDTNTAPISLPIDYYQSYSTTPFHREPIKDFVGNQSQFQDPLQRLSDQQYMNGGSGTSHQHEARYQNQYQYPVPGTAWGTHSNYGLTSSQTQMGTYMGLANHHVAEPRFCSSHPRSALAGDPFLAPRSVPVLNEKPYTCLYNCGKAYARKGDMERHARSHEPPGLWCVVEGCRFQVKGFHRKDKFADHLKTHGIKLPKIQ
ncbi:hypothetical protein MMC30_006484 [Trapelia coarctata]|nr:hypothetical protein [Trapelia coarctata]